MSTRRKPKPVSRPQKLVSTLEDDGEALLWSCRAGRGVPGFFLLLWLIPWTAGCVMLGREAFVKREWFMLLFALPFWASWVFVAGLLLYRWTGRERLTLGNEGVTFARTAVIRLTSRQIPLEDLQTFEEYVDYSDDSETRGLKLRTRGKTLKFASGLVQRELEWLVDQFNTRLAASRDRSSDFRSRTKRLQSSQGGSPGHRDGTQRESVRVLSDDIAYPPPADTRWVHTQEFDAEVFQHRGHWSPAKLGGLLFINLFWNGVVGVFLCVLFGVAPINNGPLVGVQWWFLCIFLIPFEVIGLVMLYGLVHSLLEPFCTTRYRLERYAIITRTAILGIGRKRHWPVDEIERLEVRMGNAVSRSSRAKFQMTMGVGADDDDAPSEAEIALVNHYQTDACVLGPMSPGEAEWMGSLIRRERPDWFRTS